MLKFGIHFIATIEFIINREIELMGNLTQRENKQTGNRILIEFLTPKQKIEKDRQLAKAQIEVEEESDTEIIQNFQTLYTTSFSQTVFTQDDVISYDNLFDALTHTNPKNKMQLLDVTNFFQRNVSTFQIFFNNREVTRTGQEYSFQKNNHEILNVEIVYKEKHWAERLINSIKRAGEVMKNHIHVFVNVFSVSQTLLPLMNHPLLMPALKTVQMYTGSIDFVAIGKTVGPMITGMASRAVPYLTTPTGLGALVALYYGRGVLIFFLKLVLTLFFPFLSPLFWLIGV